MRRAWGAVAIAIAIALSGCQDAGVAVADVVPVDNVPACRTWPVELAGRTYWEMPPEQVEAWIESHDDPFGGSPQPQASAAWTDRDDSIGILYRYEDGTALFIARTGNHIYFTDVEREFDTVC